VFIFVHFLTKFGAIFGPTSVQFTVYFELFCHLQDYVAYRLFWDSDNYSQRQIL